jgi:hypothetical protein
VKSARAWGAQSAVSVTRQHDTQPALHNRLTPCSGENCTDAQFLLIAICRKDSRRARRLSKRALETGIRNFSGTAKRPTKTSTQLSSAEETAVISRGWCIGPIGKESAADCRITGFFGKETALFFARKFPPRSWLVHRTTEREAGVPQNNGLLSIANHLGTVIPRSTISFTLKLEKRSLTQKQCESSSTMSGLGARRTSPGKGLLLRRNVRYWPKADMR